MEQPSSLDTLNLRRFLAMVKSAVARYLEKPHSDDPAMTELIEEEWQEFQKIDADTKLQTCFAIASVHLDQGVKAGIVNSYQRVEDGLDIQTNFGNVKFQLELVQNERTEQADDAVPQREL